MWIDTAYVDHNNIWSHTGGAMAMGQGTIHISSSKNKPNAKIST